MNSNEMLSRLEAVEKRVDEHIHDGILVWQGLEGVQNDVQWIKRGMWALVTLGVTFNGLMLKFLLAKLGL